MKSKQLQKKEQLLFLFMWIWIQLLAPSRLIMKSLILQKDNDDQYWLVNWDRGFIHPEMKNGGEMVIQTIPAKRGEILDRNKMPLAMNDNVWEVGIIPEKLGDHPEQAKEEI